MLTTAGIRKWLETHENPLVRGERETLEYGLQLTKELVERRKREAEGEAGVRLWPDGERLAKPEATARPGPALERTPYLGIYADLYLRALEERRPKEFSARDTTDLEREARRAQRRARRQFDMILAALLRASPEPSGFLKREQHFQVLTQQARELVIAELVEGIDPEDDL